MLARIARHARCVTGLTGLQMRETTELPDGAMAWVEQAAGVAIAEATSLPGGAGQRRYWRLRLANGASRVLMWARNEDPEILPPALRDQNACAAFTTVTELLAQADIPVPELFAVSPERAWILLEDLGETHLFDLQDAPLARAREQAIELLGRVHGLEGDAARLPFSRVFDREWIRFELRLFSDRLKRQGPQLDQTLDELARAIETLPRSLCLRDYQSHNLMIDADGALRVIDYQDALLAPPELDLASFLYDSYVEMSRGTRDALLDQYRAATGRPISTASLALLTVQRKCKDASRFHLLVSDKGDERYRSAFENACQTLRDALNDVAPRHPALTRGLHEALGELTL